MLDLQGREIAATSFEVPNNPEELLSMHDNPVLVQYSFSRGGVEAHLGLDLNVKNGLIEARQTVQPEGDFDWQPTSKGKAVFMPNAMRPVPDFGMLSVLQEGSLKGSISLLREATIDAGLITPERATNGMFDATRAVLTQIEKREFELITSGMIEANGVVLSQPTNDQAIVMRSERGVSIYLDAYYEKHGTAGQIGIHGKESLNFKAEHDPKSYDHWDHFSGSRGPDRGQFADKSGWGPGVLMFSPGPQSQVEVAQVAMSELFDEQGRVISPFELMSS